VAERARAMIDLRYDRKFLSIEPIMDFDLEIFVSWIENMSPIHVAVGYDNYHNNLPEPSLSKTSQLIEKLNEFTEVRKRTLREAWSR
jgi:hypothetical protein